MVQENQSATFVDSQLFSTTYYKATHHVRVALSETVIIMDILISHISYLGRRHFLSCFLEPELFADFMNICLLPQIPVLRRPKKEENNFFQRAMESPQSPSQPIPSSGHGYGPHQTPTRASWPAAETQSQPARGTGGLVIQSERVVSLDNFSNSVPCHSLSLALYSEKLFHKNCMEIMGFYYQAIKSVFKRTAIQIADTWTYKNNHVSTGKTLRNIWLDFESCFRHFRLLPILGFLKILATRGQQKSAPKVRELQ